jgi:hypothetical protein
MTISGKALGLLQKSFSDLHRCKNMLIVRPTDHIIRGFLFERTPYKGLFYFWRLVLPLYTQGPVVMLRYSKRLAMGEYIDLSDAQLEQSIRKLVGIISRDELDDLRAVSGPQEFLDRFGGASINEGYTPMISPFDAALTYYMVGNVPFCLDILDDFSSQDLHPGRVDIHISARELAREMRIDPSAAERKIQALERINIERFALRPTMSAQEPSQGGL